MWDWCHGSCGWCRRCVNSVGGVYRRLRNAWIVWECVQETKKSQRVTKMALQTNLKVQHQFQRPCWSMEWSIPAFLLINGRQPFVPPTNWATCRGIYLPRASRSAQRSCTSTLSNWVQTCTHFTGDSDCGITSLTSHLRRTLRTLRLSSTTAFTVSQIGSLQKGAPHPKSSSLWEFFTRASAHLSRMNNLDWPTI